MRYYYALALFFVLSMPANLFAETQFISDKIYLDTYVQPDEKTDVAFSILSGSVIELISVEGEYSNIKNREGKTGWINNKYLSSEKPAQIAYLQTRKKYDAALVKIRELESKRGQSKDSTKTLRALNKTRKQLKTLKDENAELENSLNVRTDSLNKSIGAINVLTEQIRALKGTNDADTDASDSTSIDKPTQPGVFTLSIAWTAAALVLALVIGFTLGLKWLERKISKRHGGVNIY